MFNQIIVSLIVLTSMLLDVRTMRRKNYDSMTARSFATFMSPFETAADYIFFFMLLLSDEVNFSCLFDNAEKQI